MNANKAVVSLSMLFVLGVVAPQFDALRGQMTGVWLAAFAMGLGLIMVIAWLKWFEELRVWAHDLSEHKWYTDASVVIVGYVMLPLMIVALGVALGINFV